MCGIAGYFSLDAAPKEAMEQTMKSMANVMRHRGPDDSDVWCDPATGIALGHRRLSILDISPLGRQPMHSPCGRYVICYNGEIYNHLEIRKELPNTVFRSTSDTETMLAAIARWGLQKAISRFVGMFAFALWDREKHSLSLVRDRLGIKPLYFGRVGNSMIFASELKALRQHPDFKADLDRDALALYFRHNYIPSPYSVYTGISKLCPGTIAAFSAPDTPCEKMEYWSAREVWMAGQDEPFQGTANEAADELERLLETAVGRRMLSDVPLGGFLSGGIDSSAVVALMQKQSTRPIRTFSIGFKEKMYNEAEHAKSIAAHLKTDHTEFYVTAKDLLDIVPSVPHYWDEPFADSSQVPTYILSRMTRDHVTVALSGDGGDELFYGYQRYFWINKSRMLDRIPRLVRRTAGSILKALPVGAFDLLGPLGPKIRWRLDILGMKDFSEYYRFIVSHFKHPDEFVLGGTEPRTALTNPVNGVGDDRFSQMALWDVLSYMPDDILTKMDRASMSVGLEARVPILDHNVVEFAAKLPTGLKVRGDRGKQVLRDVLYRHVPQKLVDRPKMGFGVPIAQWMGNELREWCEDLLSYKTIKSQGVLDADFVEKMWREYLGGEVNWNYYLWDVLMFQAWMEKWGDL